MMAAFYWQVRGVVKVIVLPDSYFIGVRVAFAFLKLAGVASFWRRRKRRDTSKY